MAQLTRAPATRRRICEKVVSDESLVVVGSAGARDNGATDPGDGEHKVVPPQCCKVLPTPQTDGKEESRHADEDPDGQIDFARLVLSVVTSHG